ncbi:MAG: pitrilysin family protein [Candidatus Nanoarchaeia archaeon]|nr:pitrilysin family protein [Candidatus Nanoarchaeia archaeon]MDD5741128.1 pitrilysin family protein [Candidatus Nanoarchaeia archaeon]
MKEPEFYRKKLDNGVTVLFERRQVPVVAVASSVKSGAQYESADIKGISHFLEHLVFKGTKKRTVQEIPKEIESKGGIINAFTGEEITTYWNKLPSKYFELGADISRDLVLNPIFEKNALERERKVILEEIKMYHDNPSTHVLEKVKEMLYRKPFNISIAGTAGTVGKLSRENIIHLFNSFYSTNNMVFSVVGKCEWEQVLEEAKKFSKTQKQIKKIPIILRNGNIVEKRKGIDQAHLVFGFHIPKLIDKNRYAAEIFDSVLGGGMSSRLFQEVREKKGLCYAIKSDMEQSKDYAYEIIYSGTVKEKIDEIKKIILKEIKKLGKFEKVDLNEEKEKLIGLNQINKEKCDLTMIDLLQEEIGGDARNYYKYEDNINSIKLEEVRKLSKLKGYSFVSLIPE